MTAQPAGRLLVAGGVILAAVLCIVLYRTTVTLERENRGLQAQQGELLLLGKEFTKIRDRVQSIEGKKSLTKDEGIAQSLDEVLSSIGLSRKMKSLKSTGAREREFGQEEEAEVQVERLTMNEMVNLFYKIEHARAILSVRKASIKTAFDNPSLLNVTMTIGFIRPK